MTLYFVPGVHTGRLSSIEISSYVIKFSQSVCIPICLSFGYSFPPEGRYLLSKWQGHSRNKRQHDLDINWNLRRMMTIMLL